MSEIASVLHDLRSPLARARTLAKLLREATPQEREEYLKLLLSALDELDSRLSLAQEPSLN